MDIQIVIDSLVQIFVDIVNFVPRLVNGLIILFVGVFLAQFIRWILRNVLKRLKFDPLMDRIGITTSLRGLGVKTPLSSMLAQIVFLLLLVSFLITASRLMGLDAVAQLLEQLLTFLPNVIAAGIVFLLGGLVAQFAGNLVTTLASSGGLSYAGRIGRLVQYLISVFTAIIALGVLGIDTALLVTALTILIGAFGLALGLALGLGARRVVHHVLAGYYVRQQFQIGQGIELADYRGEVRHDKSVIKNRGGSFLLCCTSFARATQ
jgi:small-conductance mechanosensitive channel